jgi:hypothetical protein
MLQRLRDVRIDGASPRARGAQASRSRPWPPSVSAAGYRSVSPEPPLTPANPLAVRGPFGRRPRLGSADKLPPLVRRELSPPVSPALPQGAAASRAKADQRRPANAGAPTPGAERGGLHPYQLHC